MFGVSAGGVWVVNVGCCRFFWVVAVDGGCVHVVVGFVWVVVVID